MGTVDESIGDAVLPDEDMLGIPAAWRRSLLPRRGGVPGPALAATAASIAEADALVASVRDDVLRLLDASRNEPDLVTEAYTWLRDPAAATPLGAAVVAGATAAVIDGSERLPSLADGWVAAHGVVLAARAVVELSGLSLNANESRRSGIGRRAVGYWWIYQSHWLDLAGRVRAHLAAASDEEYAQARAALTSYRQGTLRQRAATSFLLPTEAAWVEDDCREMAAAADESVAALLWCAAGTADQARLAAGHLYPWWGRDQLSLLVTAAEGVGPTLAPVLMDWFDQHWDADMKRRLLSVVSALPSDEVVWLLVERLDQKYVAPALLEAAKRYPVRVLRGLAAAADARSAPGRIAAELLRTHVLAHPAAVTAALPLLDPDARKRVTDLVEVTASVVEAPTEALPSVLVEPPWAVRRQPTKPAVIEGLSRPTEVSIVWVGDEQERWAAEPEHLAYWRTERSWEETAEACAQGQLRLYEQVHFFIRGPEALTRPLLIEWRPDGDLWDVAGWARCIVGRYGLDALPATLQVARKHPALAGHILAPYASVEVADLMADCLVRLKSARPAAIAWLARHPEIAARALIPTAFGKPGKQRRAAESALRALVAAGHAAVVIGVAHGHGEAAATAIEELLDADPLRLLPARIPALPDWADPAGLPPVLLRDRSAALPKEAARHLCTMLAISKPDDGYAGIPLVREACDPGSLAEFGWALFQRWLTAGAPSKESWAFTALRWLGDDETVRRLTPLIRAWPGESAHARAVTGLDVLAGIGTDIALAHLYGIAQKVKFRGLKERAGQKITEVAERLGLNAEQLADRLVPDLGLDDAGSLVLDYGPRRFTVGFDEQLKPYVADEAGARRKALPKPGVRDDAELATASYQRFSALKKDVRAIAADQIARLEQAMVAQRRWSASEFRKLFVAHPLLWHIARRLVWAAFDADGELVAAFRVAEDRTFADMEDDAFILDETATVGIPHPLHLGAALPDWSELFADYEILQPFAQLGRAVHVLTDAERAATVLKRFENIKIATGKLLGLERRGWQRGAPQDAGVQCWMFRAIPEGRALVVNLDPGIPVGWIDEVPEQQLEHVWVNDRSTGNWSPRGTLRFGDLDPVTASEVLRDLSEVAA